ncbi:SDR family oxidoreductase [Rhizobium jaguaris]|uniref:SDR family oxidoreductase n=1 Tax=Rhizobium jaguaris TaxID=1312183 RepID=A0A387FP20_9HYPH|nr:SDR family oxidoreductase [Rhizobium jaguaris]AYG57964.1 SDR family oxidoreductase [Rhizobium jaguaris]
MTKTVLITGASSGIGKASAKLFHGKGWNVVATMRSPDKETELTALDNVLVTRLDVSDPQSIAAAVAAGIDRFGRIDALVNNAGYGQYGVFEAVPPEKIRQQFDVNVFGVMDVTRALLPHFRANRSGVIVNVSSGAGLFTLPMISLYCASKFALEGFTEALAYELLDLNIGVKLVIPHGGVSETRFSERSAEDNALADVPGDYAPFIANVVKAFANMTAARTITSADVADVIYESVTDGSDRLRYLIGDDARGFIRARNEMTDHDYVNFMRSYFAAVK